MFHQNDRIHEVKNLKINEQINLDVRLDHNGSLPRISVHRSHFFYFEY